MERVRPVQALVVVEGEAVAGGAVGGAALALARRPKSCPVHLANRTSLRQEVIQAIEPLQAAQSML